MRKETKAALIQAAEVLTTNALFFANRAANELRKLRRAETENEAADAGKGIFFWLEKIDEEKFFADKKFNDQLGRIWEEEIEG